MERHQLARELRQRQYHLGLVERHIIDGLSDNQLIDSYITCADCGEKHLSPQMLEIVLKAANNAHEFFVAYESLERASPIVFAEFHTASTRKAQMRRRR